MNCETCVKINPVPGCLGNGASFTIDNITLPDFSGQTVQMILTDTATERKSYLNFTEGGTIALTSFFPFMQHVYKIEFTVDGVEAGFTLTNPDLTTVTGCCIEFTPLERLTWTGTDYSVSTTQCEV